MNAFHIDQISLSMQEIPLIQQLSFTCQPGEIWGILGPNGIGKTTLLHVLAGLKKPTSGRVFIAGKNILHMRPKERAQKIGLLPQQIYFPFPSTVLETAMTGRYPYSSNWFSENPEDIKIATQALELVGLHHLKQRPVSQLSGGEQRRLTLATLFAQNPDIYLLDEPTTYLDLQQRMHVLSILKKLAKE
ncbi:MAG: ABC transporter ATP-binding protein, partial [Pseudomonadota bacterium]